jgi:hypothetical protein
MPADPRALADLYRRVTQNDSLERYRNSARI